MPARRPRPWVAATILSSLSLARADSTAIPFTSTAYAASAQCTVDGNNWILYVGNSTAPYAWDAAANPDGSDFRQRTPLMHLHTTAGSQGITCQVFGTSIEVLGGFGVENFNTSAANFLTVTLDGQVLDNKVLSIQNKSEGWENSFLQVPAPGEEPLADAMHTLQIQTGTQWKGALKMWGMTANTTIPTDGWNPTNELLVDTTQGNELGFVFNNTKVSTMYKWEGGSPTIYQFPLNNVAVPERALVIKDGAKATVNLPRNSSYLEARGYSGPNYGTVLLDIDPAPPGISTLPIERETNKPWLVYDTIFESPLDPAQEYTLTYSGKPGALGAGVYLSATNVLEHSQNANGSYTGGKPNGTSEKKTNLGAIIGGAVGGGVGGLLILGLLAFCCIKRRRAAKAAKNTVTPDSDETSAEGESGGFESTPMLEKGAMSARNSLAVPGGGDRRKSTQSVRSQRDRRQSAISMKSTKSNKSRHSQVPRSRSEVESWLLPTGNYSGGALRTSGMSRPVSGRGLLDGLAPPDPSRSRPVSATSGRGLLDGLAVPPQNRQSRPISHSSGRGLLDGLAVPPQNQSSRPVSGVSSRRISARDNPPNRAFDSIPEPEPPANMSPVEQAMATLTRHSPTNSLSLPPGAAPAVLSSPPLPSAAVLSSPPHTSPAEPGAPVPFPSNPHQTHPAPFEQQRRDSAVSGTETFFSAEGSVSGHSTPLASGRGTPMGFADAQGSAPQAQPQADAHGFVQPTSAVNADGFLQPNADGFLQPNSSRPSSRNSRQAIPRDGEEAEAPPVPPSPMLDESQFHPGTAM